MGRRKKKWFKPQEDLGGWSKSQKPRTRRSRAIGSTDRRRNLDGRRETARKRLQALANVTKDPGTQRAAQADANYFSRLRKQ